MRRFLMLAIIVFVFTGCIFSKNGSKVTDPVKSGQMQYVPTLEDQLDDLTTQIVLSLSQEKKSKIAIIEFPDLQDNITQFGRFLAEELITRLYLTGKFEVIERQLLNKVMQEHQLMMSGIVDENSAKELGRILGVDAICSGSVANLVKSVKVNARLISSETGKIFSVASVKIPKDEVVNKMLGESVYSTTTGHPAIEISDSEGLQQKPGSRFYNSNELDFELTGWAMLDRTVKFELIVTNQRENDRDFAIWLLTTKFYDQLGSDDIVMNAKLANTETNPLHKGKWGGGSRLKKKLISGVPTPLTLYFESVSTQVSSISLLEINCGEMVAQFRDLDLK